jgi:hypothetical protein
MLQNLPFEIHHFEVPKLEHLNLQKKVRNVNMMFFKKKKFF